MYRAHPCIASRSLGQTTGSFRQDQINSGRRRRVDLRHPGLLFCHPGFVDAGPFPLATHPTFLLPHSIPPITSIAILRVTSLFHTPLVNPSRPPCPSHPVPSPSPTAPDPAPRSRANPSPSQTFTRSTGAPSLPSSMIYRDRPRVIPGYELWRRRGR